MTPRQLERWKRHRRVGRLHFVIRRGLVFGFGAGLAGMMFTADALGPRAGSSLINPWFIGTVVAAMGLAAGILSAWSTTWLANERDFLLAADCCTKCGNALTGHPSRRCHQC